ncbi:ABC transporter substrate-binding protein [Thalassolituus sp. LLYu03]|uniref:ABC transporter substrate-binding protein n=1 Tax=Thalassolituus sp. LLYu03 TaxID=3421656 RepID=UPI003D2AAE60
MAGLSLADSGLPTVKYRDAASLPALNWQQDTDAVSAMPNAPRGGFLTLPLTEFPDNVRRIGPDTPHALTPVLQDLQLPLLARETPAAAWIPLLAKRWAVDGKRVYFELHDNARWSDNVPVTAEDFAFSLGFILDPDTGADWQKRVLTEQISALEVFSDNRFAFVLRAPADDIPDVIAGFRPFAAHVFRNRHQWPENFNWYPEPTTGPYYLAQISADNATLTFRRTTNWWAAQLPRNQHRFNASRVILRVPQGTEEASLFQRGELDSVAICSLCAAQLGYFEQAARFRHIRLINTANSNREVHPSSLLVNGKSAVLSQFAVRQKLRESLGLDLIAQNSANLALSQLVEGSSEPVLTNYDGGVLPDTLTLSYTDTADLPLLQHIAVNAQENGLHLVLRQLSADVLATKLALGQYDLVWLKFTSPLSAEGFLSLFRPDAGGLYISNPGFPPYLLSEHDTNKAATTLARELNRLALLIPGIEATRHSRAFWEWIRFPEETDMQSDPIAPFDPLTGGRFWIDRKERAAILAQPERGNPS